MTSLEDLVYKEPSETDDISAYADELQNQIAYQLEAATQEAPHSMRCAHDTRKHYAKNLYDALSRIAKTPANAGLICDELLKLEQLAEEYDALACKADDMAHAADNVRVKINHMILGGQDA